MKKFLSLAAISFFFLSVAQFAFAQTPTPITTGTTINLCPANSGTGNYNILCALDPATALPFLFTAIIVIAIVVALVFLIWGGIKWVISGGDKAKVDAARSTIVAAIVGLIIIFLAWFIINLVTQVFFGTNATGGIIPHIQIAPTG